MLITAGSLIAAALALELAHAGYVNFIPQTPIRPHSQTPKPLSKHFYYRQQPLGRTHRSPHRRPKEMENDMQKLIYR